MNDKLNLKKTNLIEYLIESSVDFIDLYEKRLENFKKSTEGIEIEFLEGETRFFENCISDLKKYDLSVERYSYPNSSYYSEVVGAADIIGSERLCYSTKRKLEFLYSRFEIVQKKLEEKELVNQKLVSKSIIPEIEVLKNKLKGLSKEEKLNYLIQTLSDIGLSNGKHELNDFINEIDELKEEIKSNPEAYQNKYIDTKFIPFVYDRDLDWYFNAKNIPNQDLVFATYDYFNEGPRMDMFEALFFLNFLYYQYDLVKLNFETPFKVLTFLKNLPVVPEELHVILGFILKWFGGYPVNNMNAQFDTTLRLIEREFLNYPTDTPEKKFCHRDMDNYVRMKELENYLNLKINNPNSEVSIPEGLKSTQFENLFEPFLPSIAVKSKKPYFIEDFRLPLIDILKPFFDTKQHNSLKDLFVSSIEPVEKLFFKSQGNRLAHAFRVLINEDIITQQNKIELESWICENFTYLKDNSENSYTKKYLNDIISSNSDKCKKPILKVVTNGEGKKILEKA